MVRISIDTEKDSPEMIAKLIDVLHAHLGKSSSTQVPMPSSYSLPSSAPVSSEPSMFDIFGSEDRPNNQSLSNISSQPVASSNPFSMFDEPTHSNVESNSVAGYADDNLFNAFSTDLPSTNFNSPTPSLQSIGLEASFASAQTLLDDNFNPIKDEDDEDEPEEKSSNFFNFEQY